MSRSARTDDIDALMSSVRDFVSHKDQHKNAKTAPPEKLVLRPDQLVAGPTLTDAQDLAPGPMNPDDSDVNGADNIHLLDIAARAERVGIEATLSALEAAIAQPVDDWEADETAPVQERQSALGAFREPRTDSSQDPEKPADRDNAPQPEAAQDPAPVRMMRTAGSGLGLQSETPESILAAAGVRGMTAEALRALMVEVVHEELAGELGERITRNVRKLVRREINRVLVSRELEQD